MRKALTSALFLAASMFAANAQAATLTYELNFVYTGELPDSTPPYLLATFRDGTDCDPDCNANTVQLILTASLEDTTEFVTEWDFNATEAVTVAFTDDLSGTFAVPDIGQYNPDNYKAGGDGLYDFSIIFSSAGGPGDPRFAGTDSALFTITGTTISVNTFLALSAPDGGAGPFYSAAHVQGITPDCSGWVADTNGGTPGGGGSATGVTTCVVPDSGSTLSLLGLGILGLGYLARKRRIA